VWWDRLAGLLQGGMAGPRTWKRLKEITEKMVGGKETEAERDDGGLGRGPIALRRFGTFE
jgi:hypothetical protein